MAQKESNIQGAGKQIVHSDYIELMRNRALGALPDMGCAIRISEIIQALKKESGDQSIDRLIDVGCATGHYFRTFQNMNLPIREYIGVDIDKDMIASAKSVWRENIENGRMRFLQDDIESPNPLDKADILICMNSFMYYKSAKKVLEKFLKSSKIILIRSLFADSNFRILRGQSNQNNDAVDIDELELFSESGDLKSADFWTIYSFSYIERLVKQINPRADVVWLKDQNKIDSIQAESKLGVVKRGGTQVIGGYEISYPILQPWEILQIKVN